MLPAYKLEMGKARYTIFLAGSDMNTLSDLKLKLELEKFSVDAVFNSLLATQLIDINKYDFAIVDSALLGADGTPLCNSIPAARVSAPILIITTATETENKLQRGKYDAKNYFVKPVRFNELLVRIKTLIREKSELRSVAETLQISDLKINVSTKLVERGKLRLNITPREFDILVCLALANGKVVKKKDLIYEIWGKEGQVNINTLDVHISLLRHKIDKGQAIKLVNSHSGFGYYLSPVK